MTSACVSNTYSLSLYSLRTSTPQFARPPCQSTIVLILVRPIHYISSDEGSEPFLVHQRLFVSSWSEEACCCSYTLWNILRISTCHTHLGISEHKSIHSFVGRLQGIRTLKISEAMTFFPTVDISCMNFCSVGFMTPKNPKSVRSVLC
jgi:hypothetical protein